jgi:hypothetical protein
LEAGSGSASKSKKLQRLKTEPWRAVDAHNEHKMEPCRVYRLVVADSHPFDEKQDQDPDPH